jgi:hypothetical protein
MKIFSIILILVVCCSCTAQHKVASNIIDVDNAINLQEALNNAKAGDHIVLKDGIYKGNFIIPSSANGTSDKPISLYGSKKVILDGNTIAKGYVLHLQASYWTIKDITITNGLKGLMCDGANYNIIDNITVNNIGEEGIHFRKFSTHNVLQRATITNTGLKTADYGEGVYIGTAVSNWSRYTNGLEDKCDSNKVINNTIGPNITAECIDVKEGSTGGIISQNHFNSTGITGANSGDSWMDVKGNGYLIESNSGFNPSGSVLKDGYQVHCAVDGWGSYNIFKNNSCEINVEGYGINVVLKSNKGNAVGNVVYKNNVMKGLNKSITNIELTD